MAGACSDYHQQTNSQWTNIPDPSKRTRKQRANRRRTEDTNRANGRNRGCSNDAGNEFIVHEYAPPRAVLELVRHQACGIADICNRADKCGLVRFAWIVVDNRELLAKFD